MDFDGNVWLLQSRQITALPHERILNSNRLDQTLYKLQHAHSSSDLLPRMITLRFPPNSNFASFSLQHFGLYCTRAIITHGLYIFYSIFHRGLYCRPFYNAERLIVHDSLFLIPKGITGSSATILQYSIYLRKDPKDP